MYHTTNLFFIVFTIACALAKNMGQLIAFRLFAGIGGSAVLTMGAGTLSDLFIQEERGRAMALWACGPLIGPVAGPVAGGFLAQAKGWRWIFWVISMGAGAAALLMALVLSETYGPTILERKAKKLRKETGNSNLKSALDTGLSPREAFKRGIFRPLRMLIFSPIVALLTIYNSVVYGYLYVVFTTITEVFEEGYHFSQGVVGLTFLGIGRWKAKMISWRQLTRTSGVGMFLGLLIFGGLSDWLLKRRAQKGEMKPEYRLPPMVVVSVFIPIGMFIYGWTAEKLTFWFWPIFGTAWLGFGLLGVFVRSFPHRARIAD
jgi:multidrug resistance protein